MTATRPAASRATAKPAARLGLLRACGHKMVVQYKGGTRYLCNYLRQQHGARVPVHPGRPDRCGSRRRLLPGARAGPSSTPTRGAWRPGVERTRRCCAPRRSRSSGCATGRRWPNGNTTRSIRTTVWSRPNWNAVGKRRCATCARPRRRWTRRVRGSAKPPFRSMTGCGRRSPTPVGAFPSSGTARP